MMSQMVSGSWGIKAYIVETWYKMVIEKTLTYDATIWRHNLTIRNKEVLTTCQRHFLQAIIKAYKIAPTAALQILAGMIPIHLQVRNEAAYGTISRLRVSRLNS